MQEAQRLAQAAAEQAKEADEAETKASPDSARYVVAEGKTLYTDSGLLGSYQEVSASHFAGGRDELERHIKSGVVVLRT